MADETDLWGMAWAPADINDPGFGERRSSPGSEGEAMKQRTTADAIHAFREAQVVFGLAIIRFLRVERILAWWVRRKRPAG